MTNQRMTTGQIRAACALLGWTSRELAEAAGLPTAAIAQWEAGGASGADVENALRTALEKAGIAFLFENEASYSGGAGVRLEPSEPDEGLRPEELNAENDG